MEEYKKRVFMSFDIDPELRREIKVLAAIRGISVTSWLHRAIYERIRKEARDDKDGSQSVREMLERIPPSEMD